MIIKNLIKKNRFIYTFFKEKQLISNWKKNKKRYNSEINKWNLNNNYNIYNHFIKQHTIKKYAEMINAKSIVETGTFYGEMMYMLYDDFENLFTIEVSEDLYTKLNKRFNSFKKIKLFNGDSSNVLKDIIPKLKNNTVFWLDGHYSGGETGKGELNCPIKKELEIISLIKEFKVIILIDDARLFNGKDDYPTHDELQHIVNIFFPKHQLNLESDIYVIKEL